MNRRLRKLRDGIGPKVKGVKVDDKYLSNNFVWRLLEECDKDPIYKQKIRAIFDVSVGSNYKTYYRNAPTDLKVIFSKVMVYCTRFVETRSLEKLNYAFQTFLPDLQSI